MLRTRDLDSLGKTNTVVPEVKLGVIRTNENISQNPQGASRHIDTKETTKALGLPHYRHLKDEDFWMEVN